MTMKKMYSQFQDQLQLKQLHKHVYFTPILAALTTTVMIAELVLKTIVLNIIVPIVNNVSPSAGSSVPECPMGYV